MSFWGRFFSAESEPVVNIDGAPMIPDTNIDINGHAYGMTSMSDTTTSWASHDSSCDFSSDFGGGGCGFGDNNF